MDLKEISRDRMDMRIHANETFKSLINWIQQSNPSTYLPKPDKGEDQIIPRESATALYRDYVTKAGELITKMWKPADLMADDLVALMEREFGKIKGSSENKSGIVG